MKKFFENVVDILYPPCCPICGKIYKSTTSRGCNECIKELHYVGRNRCMKCGKTLDVKDKEYCYDCEKVVHIFDVGFALWEYDEKVKKSVYDFKYNNQREYGNFYADEIFRRYEKELKALGAQVIVPVPLHKTKERSRGYNQAEVIAVELGKKMDMPVEKLLFRVRTTLPQKELNDKERRINLENAFQIDKKGVKYKKVILLDDIYTTGATMDACAKVLKEAGVEKVYSLCLCIGKGF